MKSKHLVKINFLDKILCLAGVHKLTRFYNDTGLLNTKYRKCLVCKCNFKL